MDDRELPLDGENPEIMESTDPVWGKQGEWLMYNQHDQKMYEKAMAEKAEAIYGKEEGPQEEWSTDYGCDGEKEGVDDYVRGCLIFYIDVGQLPPFKAEAFVERMKQQLNDRGGLDRIKKDQEVFFVPVRNGKGTRVEYIAFN